MTPQQAKDTLTNTIIVPARVVGKTIYGRALRVALAALDKQIARKVLPLKFCAGQCPSCMAVYEDMEKPKHCENCGQALDWEVNDDQRKAD